MASTAHVLTLNSGSSTLKFGSFEVGPAGAVQLFAETVATLKPEAALVRIVEELAGIGRPAPSVIGHRVVHGGPLLRQHCFIDEEVLRQIQASAAFAPLHNAAALAFIHMARQHFPGIPQVACFDTGFHADLPDLARVLPLDKALRGQGIQRYGFHGLSLESIVRQLGDDTSTDVDASVADGQRQARSALPERIVVAHLGNGASVTAIRCGRSVDTSMGLTPSGGVIMGTRSGDIDPGVLLQLLRKEGFDAAGLEELVDHRAGLLGISGLSSDMRQLHAAAATHPDAALAIAMFCASVRKHIAAMISVLDGLDLLVFTGGIGENDAAARAQICAGLAWIGIRLDESRNRSGSKAIHDLVSRCQVRVIASQEDEQIALHAWALLGGH